MLEVHSPSPGEDACRTFNFSHGHGSERVIDLTNESDLERWLEDKPREVSAVLAARSALRVVPLLFDSVQVGGWGSQNIFLPVIGAMAAAWAGARYPTRRTEFRATTSSALYNVWGGINRDSSVAHIAEAADKAVRTILADIDPANAVVDVVRETMLALEAQITPARVRATNLRTAAATAATAAAEAAKKAAKAAEDAKTDDEAASSVAARAAASNAAIIKANAEAAAARVVPAKAVADAAGAEAASIEAAILPAVRAFRLAVVADLEFIDKGMAPAALADQPLWLNEAPELVKSAWKELERTLIADHVDCTVCTT